jgi:DNA-binding IscR family transcriptional regulator
LRRLVVASLLVARRGHGGGFALARPARLICFSEIVAAVGHAPQSERCVFGWGNCSTVMPCPLHPAFSRLNGAVWHWLQETTLSNVTQPKLRVLAAD